MQSSIADKISKIFLIWQRYHKNLLQNKPLTLKQFSVLQELSQVEFLYPSDISKIIYADRPTTSVILNNLYKNNFITKTIDPTQKKYTQISITTKGKEALEECVSHIKLTKNIKLTQNLSTEEKQQLNYLLDKILQNLHNNNL